jgi:AhpD family alkylhydroperoxidase
VSKCVGSIIGNIACCLHENPVAAAEEATSPIQASTIAESGEKTMFDMKNLTRLKKLDENAPETMKAFWAFDKAVFAAGTLSVHTKQLLAVAVALTTQCPYCIELHNRAAREAGATDAQLTEVALVAAAMRAGAAITHSTHLFGSSG